MQAYLVNGTVADDIEIFTAKTGAEFGTFKLRIFQPNKNRNFMYIKCYVWGDEMLKKSKRIFKKGNQVFIQGILRDKQNKATKYSQREIFVSVTEASLLVKGLGSKDNNDGTQFDPTLEESDDEMIIGGEL